MRSGFTLIEAALATVILGTGVLSILAAQQAFHLENAFAQRSGTAILLANELRELTLGLPLHDPISGTETMGPDAGEVGVGDFDDVDDFAGPVQGGFGTTTVFDPPINALRQPIDGMDGWRQVVTVENVLPGFVSATLTQPLGTTDIMRVTVDAQFQGPNDAEPTTVTRLRWLVVN